MAYITSNLASKKELKAAIAGTLTRKAFDGSLVPRKADLTVWSPGPFPVQENGVTTIEGPHYPKPHKWYAKVQVENGVVVKVLG